jgi:soluble lytic murein transglycosylase-like protein
VLSELLSKDLGGKCGHHLLPVGIALALFFYPGELAHRDQEKTPNAAHSMVPHAMVPLFKVPRSEKPAAHLNSEAGNPEQRFQGLILAASRRHSVDPALVKALIRVESGYDPQAISAKGAVGLMQLMPDIAASLGVKDSFDPVHNVYGGVKHLSELLDHFDGSVYLAVAAYHAGINRVKDRPQLPKSTERFVERVFGYYHSYKTGMEEGGNRV